MVWDISDLDLELAFMDFFSNIIFGVVDTQSLVDTYFHYVLSFVLFFNRKEKNFSE